AVGPFLEGLDLYVLVGEPAGCPNASLEAMAAGLPVVATDVGGMGEQGQDGVTGRLGPRGGPAGPGGALAGVGGDPGRRGAAGRRLGPASRSGLASRGWCGITKGYASNPADV